MNNLYFSTYPKVITMMNNFDDINENAKRYIFSIVNEYNYDLKQLKKMTSIGGIERGLIIRIYKNIRRDYLKRIDSSIKLKDDEKSFLKNYIVSKYRNEIKLHIRQKKVS